jgi:hypothetical protein
MGENLSPEGYKALKEELQDYLKSNRWLLRYDLAKTLKEQGVTLSDKHGGVKLNPSESDIKKILSEPIYPGEKKIGKVMIQGGSNKQTLVYNPENDIADRLGEVSTTYKIEEAGWKEGYRVTRHSPNDFTKVVKDIPSKEWAIKYAVYQLDKSQPKPPKFTERERVLAKAHTFSKIDGDVKSHLLKFGNISKAVAVDDMLSRPKLPYGGKAKGVFADGFMLILDKETADKLNDAVIKKDTATIKKLNPGGVNDYIAGMLKENKDSFPDYQQLIPKDNLKEWKIIGSGSLEKGAEHTVTYLSNGERIAAIDSNKLALIYDNISGIDKIQSSSISSAFLFTKNGKPVAVVMPMFIEQSAIPQKAVDTVKEITGIKPRTGKGESIKGISGEVAVYKGLPMRRRDIYKALILEGSGKKYAYHDALVSMRDYPKVDKIPVDYNEYAKVIKPLTDRKKEIDNKLTRTYIDDMTKEERENTRDALSSEFRLLNEKIAKAIETLADKYSKPQPVQSKSTPEKKETRQYTQDELKGIHESRNTLSRLSDEARKHGIVLDSDSPKVNRWVRNPGLADIRGIDTPSRKKKRPVKKSRRQDKPATLKGIRR